MQRTAILVAEDDPDHRNIVVTYLRFHGYEVLEATDGAEAVRAAAEHRPALVLMDARLPELDGWKATEQIKQNPATADIPVVILTAHALDGDRMRSARSGCDGFIAKPCEPAHILAEVQSRVGPGGGANA